MAKIIKGNFGNENKDDARKAEHSIKHNRRKTVSLKLSLTEREESITSNVQRENLEDELNSFSQVYEGDINIAGVYAFDMGKSWEVKAFLRNGTKGPINFDKVALAIINSKKEVLASQVFNMLEAGVLPPYSARPFKLNFSKENVYVKNIPMDDWKIVFDKGVGTVTYENFEFEGLPDTISEENRLILESFLRRLPRIEKDRFDFSKFSIGINENGEIITSIIVRNGFDKPLTITKIPITIVNEEGKKVFSATFEVQDFKVNTKKARLLNLVCKTDMRLTNDMDLSNWEVIF